MLSCSVHVMCAKYNSREIIYATDYLSRVRYRIFMRSSVCRCQWFTLVGNWGSILSPTYLLRAPFELFTQTPLLSFRSVSSGRLLFPIFLENLFSFVAPRRICSFLRPQSQWFTAQKFRIITLNSRSRQHSDCGWSLEQRTYCQNHFRTSIAV